MGRTQTEKLWIIGSAAVALLLAVIGWFFLISPQRSQTSAIKAQTATAQLANTSLQARIASLTSQRKQLKGYEQSLTRAAEALPAVDDPTATPAFLRTLQSLAAATSTQVSQVTVGTPTALASAAPATTSDTGTSTSSAPASSDTSSSDTTATTPAAPDVYTVAISATVTGSTGQLRDFLTQLQSVQPRAVLVTAVTLGSQAPVATSTNKNAGGRTTLNLTMTAFASPSTQTASVVAPVPTTTGDPGSTDPVAVPTEAVPSPTSAGQPFHPQAN